MGEALFGRLLVACVSYRNKFRYKRFCCACPGDWRPRRAPAAGARFPGHLRRADDAEVVAELDLAEVDGGVVVVVLVEVGAHLREEAIAEVEKAAAEDVAVDIEQDVDVVDPQGEVARKWSEKPGRHSKRRWCRIAAPPHRSRGLPPVHCPAGRIGRRASRLSCPRKTKWKSEMGGARLRRRRCSRDM